MLLQELHDDFLAKAVTNSSLIGLPISLHICWIGPKKIVEKSVVGNVRRAGDVADVVHVAERRAETAVNTENFACYDSCNWQCVECVDERLPDLHITTPLAFVVESVHSGDVGAFVVAAKQEEVLWVSNLVAQKQQDSFETLLATVDVVTEEEVVGLWRETTVLEETEEVVVLAVNVTADLEFRSVSC